MNLFKVIILSIMVIFFLSCINYHNLRNTEKQILVKKKSWDDIISNCYYINLDRSTDRKIYMENMLEKCKIPYERFNAIEGKDKVKKYKNLNISVGALGCKLSHLELLKKIKKVKNNGWTIIFEDDILIDDSRPVKQEILDFISTLPSDAELVLFGTSPRCLWWNIATFGFKNHSNNIWSSKRNLSCAHAYAINYTGAQKWIKHIKRNLSTQPFDMHSKGIDIIYLCLKEKGNMFQDLSYITQNKSKFGYFDSLVTEYPF